jgi:hypothetical protein
MTNNYHSLAVRVQQSALNNPGISKTQLLLGDLWREVQELRAMKRDFELSLQADMEEASRKYFQLLARPRRPW